MEWNWLEGDEEAPFNLTLLYFYAYESSQQCSRAPVPYGMSRAMFEEGVKLADIISLNLGEISTEQLFFLCFSLTFLKQFYVLGLNIRKFLFLSKEKYLVATFFDL